MQKGLIVNLVSQKIEKYNLKQTLPTPTYTNVTKMKT